MINGCGGRENGNRGRFTKESFDNHCGKLSGIYWAALGRSTLYRSLL